MVENTCTQREMEAEHMKNTQNVEQNIGSNSKKVKNSTKNKTDTKNKCINIPVNVESIDTKEMTDKKIASEDESDIETECAKRKKIEENSVTTGGAESTGSCKRIKYPETMKSFIKNMVESKKPLKAILNDEYYKPMPFTKVYVGQVKSVKDLSKIILLLNQKLPLKNLSHLKRACRKEVILFPINYLDSQTHTSIQYYLEENLNELRDSFEYFKIVDVPSIAPKLRKQYDECARSWSCNFHPDKYFEKLFANDLFTDKEIEQHRIFMSITFEVAEYHMKKEKQACGPYDIMSADLNATVIVDPLINSVVAVAFDNRIHNPVQHSAMLAIDNVAKTQNGGVWDTYDIDSISLRGIGHMELLLYLRHKYPNIKFGARDYISKSDLDKSDLRASESPYLCTGYYVYMIREPCFMCAMGLVHARSKRVFFCMKNLMGALTSLTKLHCNESLNHHFEVFTDFL